MTAKPDSPLVAKAVAAVDRDRLVERVVDFTDIPSPTGSEADMGRAYHEVLGGAGKVPYYIHSHPIDLKSRDQA